MASDVTIPQISAVINRHYSAGYPVDTSATRPGGEARLPGYDETFTTSWNGQANNPANNPSATDAEQMAAAAAARTDAETAGDAAVAAAIADLLDGAHTHRVECPPAPTAAPSSPKSFISGYARPAGATGGEGCGTGSTGPRPAGCLYFRGFTSPSGDSIQVATKVRRYSWSDERTVWRDASITGGRTTGVTRCRNLEMNRGGGGGGSLTGRRRGFVE